MSTIAFTKSLYFFVGTHDFKALKVNPTPQKDNFYYFYDTNQGRLIKYFVLQEGDDGKCTICEVKLINKDNNQFSPKLIFRVIDKQGDEKQTDTRKTKEDTLKVIQLEEEEVRKNFWELIDFIKSLKEVEVPSSHSFSMVDQKEKGVIKLLQSNNIEQETLEKIIENVLSQGNKDEIVHFLTEDNPDFGATLLQGVIQKQRYQVLQELENRIARGEYYETQGDGDWQTWINEHNWLFGVNYLDPIEKQIVGIGGSEPDYLFPTIDGFIDVLEIKLPEDQVLKYDSHHIGSWVWTEKVNKAIGQVVTYLDEIEKNRFAIEQKLRDSYQKNISCSKPRAFILVGQRVEHWSDQEIRALRSLNSAFHRVEVLTYTDLLERGQQFVDTDIKI